MTPPSYVLSSAYRFSYGEPDTGTSSLGNSGPSTPFNGSLLSPINFCSSENNHTALYSGNQYYNSIYTQLLDKCQNLEEQLAREICNHKALQYVYAFSVLYHNVTCWT
jgi:hypothetical protein